MGRARGRGAGRRGLFLTGGGSCSPCFHAGIIQCRKNNAEERRERQGPGSSGAMGACPAGRAQDVGPDEGTRKVGWNLILQIRKKSNK